MDLCRQVAVEGLDLLGWGVGGLLGGNLNALPLCFVGICSVLALLPYNFNEPFFGFVNVVGFTFNCCFQRGCFMFKVADAPVERLQLDGGV